MTILGKATFIYIVGTAKSIKAILVFDASVPIGFVRKSKDFFKEMGIELVYLSGNNEIDPKYWVRPAKMSDHRILGYAECIWGVRCIDLGYIPPALFITRDRDFNHIRSKRIRIVVATQGNADELKARMMLDMAHELEIFVPGIARLMCVEMRRRGIMVSEEFCGR